MIQVVSVTNPITERASRMLRLFCSMVLPVFLFGCGQDTKTVPVTNTNQPLPPAPMGAGAKSGGAAKSGQPAMKAD